MVDTLLVTSPSDVVFSLSAGERENAFSSICASPAKD